MKANFELQFKAFFYPLMFIVEAESFDKIYDKTAKHQFVIFKSRKNPLLKSLISHY